MTYSRGDQDDVELEWGKWQYTTEGLAWGLQL